MRGIEALTYPYKRYKSSVSNSSTFTSGRCIGFASDLPSTTLPSPHGSENTEENGESRGKMHWGTRKSWFSTYIDARGLSKG